MGMLAVIFGLIVYAVLACRDSSKTESFKAQSRSHSIQNGYKTYGDGKGRSYHVKTGQPCAQFPIYHNNKIIGMEYRNPDRHYSLIERSYNDPKDAGKGHSLWTR